MNTIVYGEEFVGSKACGGPAFALEPGTIYFLTLPDMESIPEQTRKKFTDKHISVNLDQVFMESI